jgi:hypothetical protein
MTRFKHGSSNMIRNWTRHKSAKFWIVAALLLLLAVFVVERFITQGTILGYKVRQTSSESRVNKAKSGGLVNQGKIGDPNNTIACQRTNIDTVRTVLGDPEVQKSSIAPDRTEPRLVSSCLFYSAQAQTSGRTGSLLIRDQNDVAAAQKIMQTLGSSEDTTRVDDIGDEAVFNDSSNQLTYRKDRTLYTITVSSKGTEPFDSKAASTGIASAVN